LAAIKKAGQSEAGEFQAFQYAPDKIKTDENFIRDQIKDNQQNQTLIYYCDSIIQSKFLDDSGIQSNVKDILSKKIKLEQRDDIKLSDIPQDLRDVRSLIIRVLEKHPLEFQKIDEWFKSYDK